MGEMDQVARVTIGSARAHRLARYVAAEADQAYRQHTPCLRLRVEIAGAGQMDFRGLGQHPGEREPADTTASHPTLQRNVEVQMSKEEAILFPAISDLAQQRSPAPPSGDAVRLSGQSFACHGGEQRRGSRALHEIKPQNNYTHVRRRELYRIKDSV
jgi:hypothetical protein